MVTIVSHRGIRAFAPENTLVAIKEAVSLGINWIDVDVVLTKDHQFVCYHDLKINNDILKKNNKFTLSNHSNLIIDFTLQELQDNFFVFLNKASSYSKFFPNQKNYPDVKITSLEEVVIYLKSLKNLINLEIEIKNDFYDTNITPMLLARLMYDFIKEHNLFLTVKIQAFDWRILYYINQFDSKINTAYLHCYKDNWYTKYNNSIINDIIKKLSLKKNDTFIFLIKSLGGYSVEVEDYFLSDYNFSKKFIKLAHDANLKVFVWSWPEHSGWVINKELLVDLIHLGIDGIITDDPIAVKKLI